MTYDEELAERIRRAVQNVSAVREQAMFGGMAFLADGHMFCGIVGQDLMLQIGSDEH